MVCGCGIQISSRLEKEQEGLTLLCSPLATETALWYRNQKLPAVAWSFCPGQAYAPACLPPAGPRLNWVSQQGGRYVPSCRAPRQIGGQQQANARKIPLESRLVEGPSIEELSTYPTTTPRLPANTSYVNNSLVLFDTDRRDGDNGSTSSQRTWRRLQGKLIHFPKLFDVDS